jgi:hypothetical protein
MVRPREKYATAITAPDPPNIAIGTHRNHRFRSQRSAYQLQKTPSAIGSAKAPKADSPPARARRPSAKSVASAATDVHRVAGASEGSSARNTVSRFGHPNDWLSPSRPKWVTHKSHDVSAQRQLPAAAATR